MHAEFPTLSFLSIVLLLLILPGQLKSHTIPAVSVICWLFVCNIIHGVNSILWADSLDDHAPVWCDIASKILLGAMVAIPGAFFCISRQLELLTSRHEHVQKHVQYKTLVEVVMCIVIPVVYMALHVIVQNHRFTIVEDLGCQAAIHRSLTGLVLVWLPPLVISLLALLYNVSALINLARSRYNSVAYFPSRPEMSFSLFARRLAYATIGMLYTATVYVIVTSWSSTDMEPWTSVSKVHANFSQVETVLRGTAIATGSELLWWTIPIWSLLLCALTAFGEETRKGYRTILSWISSRTGKNILPTQYAFMVYLPGRPCSRF
ncbi:GPCR fungal pheromone mating factor [Amylostereum chailletii]|nr:GPCR fungal pheromone mating factor [Amylostereum chailletii]